MKTEDEETNAKSIYRDFVAQTQQQLLALATPPGTIFCSKSPLLPLLC